MEEQSSVFGSGTIAGFPQNIQDDVNGLIWLGYLEDEFEFCGHHFVIRTLNGEEELQSALLAKEYIETVGQAKAAVWATVALCLLAVDEDEDFCPPIGRDDKAHARARFQFVTKWFWPTGLYIFNRHAALLERQAQAMEQVEDFYNGNLHSSTPFADSLTGRASSEDAPSAQEVLGLLDPEDEDSTGSNNDS